MFKKAKENKKGFTLAELLIVVAIIAVLVAISIPIFTTQLEKSRDAVSIANIRAAYAEASAAMLTSNGKAVTEGNVSVAAPDGGKVVVTVSNVVLKGTKPGDKFSNLATELPVSNAASIDDPGKTNTKCIFTYTLDSSGNATSSPALTFGN